MVKTIKGGFTTSGEGATALAGEALGISNKKPEKETEPTKEEESMEKKIVKLLVDNTPDQIIRDKVGCSDAQLQVIKMYLGDIKDKVKVEKEKVEVVEDKPPEEPAKEKPPEKVWDPFATGVEPKKETKKVKLVFTVWDPLSPDKPTQVEVPMDEAVPEEPETEEAEEETSKTKKEQIQDLLKEGKNNSEIAKEVGVSRSYVLKIRRG